MKRAKIIKLRSGFAPRNGEGKTIGVYATREELDAGIKLLGVKVEDMK